jgi:alpha-glucosidase (family GH31 glycosyl hydrolase)
MLVAPVTTPGTTATTSVWFPPGNTWTDYFTGKTYAGGTTQNVTTDLSTMPVFVKSGGIVTTRTDNVANDVQNPLTKVTATVAEGSNGTASLYQDNGVTTNRSLAAVSHVRYAKNGAQHQVQIDPTAGRATQQQWTVAFLNATAPKVVTVNGRALSAKSWQWNADTRTLTVTAPACPSSQGVVVAYR